MSVPVSVTTLVENTANQRGLLGEHGLAVLVEAGGQKILFDTGAGSSLVHNAGNLGIDLSQVDAIVLSHGHYDHTGGLVKTLELTGSKKVYAHPDIFNEKYRVETGEKPRYVGIPWSRQRLEECGARFVLHRESLELVEGILLTGEIPRATEFEKQEERFKIKSGNVYIQDLIRDDQALVIRSVRGLVLVVGCAHSGLVNTLYYAMKLTGENTIYAVLGGTHLLNASADRINCTMEALKQAGVERVGVCHCTGFKASVAFYQAFGDKFFFYLESVLKSNFTQIFFLNKWEMHHRWLKCMFSQNNTKTKLGASKMTQIIQLDLLPMAYYNTLGFDKELIDYLDFVDDSIVDELILPLYKEGGRPPKRPISQFRAHYLYFIKPEITSYRHLERVLKDPKNQDYRNFIAAPSLKDVPSHNCMSSLYPICWTHRKVAIIKM